MRRFSAIVVLAYLTPCASLFAQEARKPVAAPAATADPAKEARKADEKAIGDLVDAFVKAFNAGKAEDVAATYTEDALVIDEVGERVEGRKALLETYAETFADQPGSTIKIEVESFRFLSPEAAIEEGLATITPAKGGGAPDTTRFTVVYVKQGGKWLQAAVRDEATAELTPADRLKELEWMLGDWVNENSDSVVSTTCKWAKGGNFLDREFSIKVMGRPVMTGTQRIGWDPLKKQFKTWIFDSEGGHGEGYFTRLGNEWVVKVEGVNEKGEPVTATNVITRLDKDRMGWQSTARTVGGSAVPGINEFVVVRKPPEVGK